MMGSGWLMSIGLHRRALTLLAHKKKKHHQRGPGPKFLCRHNRVHAGHSLVPFQLQQAHHSPLCIKRRRAFRVQIENTIPTTVKIRLPSFGSVRPFYGNSFSFSGFDIKTSRLPLYARPLRAPPRNLRIAPSMMVEHQ